MSGTTGGWFGDTPIVFSFRWQRCGAYGSSCEDAAASKKKLVSIAGRNEILPQEFWRALEELR